MDNESYYPQFSDAHFIIYEFKNPLFTNSLYPFDHTHSVSMEEKPTDS